VHMLSAGAFNAFLKTLEEPPAHVKFVFATTDPQKVPETVRSRCQRYDFRLIPERLIAARIREILAKEAIEADDEAVALVAREAAGSLRDGLSLLDQVVALSGGRIEGKVVADVLGLTDRAVLFAMSGAILSGNAPAALAAFDQAVARGADLTRLARDFLEHLRNLVVASLGGSEELLRLPDAERATAAKQIQGKGTDDLDARFLVFAKTADEIARSAHAKVLFEMALVRMAHQGPIVPVEELVTRLEGLEGRLQGGGGARAAAPAPAPAPVPAPAAVAAPTPVVVTAPAAAPAPAAVAAAAPAAPPPPVAPAAPPAVRLTGDRMADWRQLLAHVEAERPALASLLQKLVPLAIGPREVRLGYAADSFEGAQASDPQRLKALRDIVRQVLDPAAKVEVVPLPKDQGGPTVAAEDAAARAAEIEAAKRRIEANPAVQLAAEVLGPVSKPLKVEVEG
jgi:DNA polymerase III subunit gamma/tau